MTKENLMRYKKIESEKIYISNQLEKLRARCERVTSSMSDCATGGNSQKDDAYALLIDETEMYDVELKKLILEQRSIEKAVFGISDLVTRQILRLRYLKGFSWKQVSNSMGISEATLFRLHSEVMSGTI